MDPFAAASPTYTPPVVDDLAVVRRANRREQRRADRRVVREAAANDWFQPYMDLVMRDREGWIPLGPSTVAQRRRGQNWPIFRTEQELALLRFPARVLCATNGYAQGLRSGVGCYLLGTGATYPVKPRKGVTPADVPASLVDAVQRIVDDFMTLNEWAGGEQYPVEKEFFERSVEDGEALLLSFPDAESGDTQVRFADPEQLTQPPGDVELDGFYPDELDTGFGVITHKRDVANPLAYYLQFGDTKDDGEVLARDQVLHLKRNARRAQKRGLTDFMASSLDQLDQAGKLLGNSGDAAAQQAAIVSVMKYEQGTADQIRAIDLDAADSLRHSPYSGRNEYFRQTRRGERQGIGAGQQYVEGPAASNATAHLAILSALLRGASVKWNAPEWIASADASNTVYASSLTAESPFTLRIRQEQSQYAAAWRRVVWTAVRHKVRTCGLVVAGRRWTWEQINALLDLCVTLPSPIARNRLEEAQVAGVEIPLGVQSQQGYCESVGRDYRQIQADLDEHVRSAGGSGDPLALPGLDDDPPPAGGGFPRP